MARKTKIIYDLKRAYDVCTNPEKDVIMNNALTQIKALPQV